ncbi:hypothetical protein BBOR36S_00393 [Brevibacillus borstelensis]
MGRDEEDSEPCLGRNEEDSEPCLGRDEEDSEPCLVCNEENSKPRMVRNEEDSEPRMVRNEKDSEPRMVRNEENSEPRMVRNEENSEPRMVCNEKDSEPRMVRNEEDSEPRMVRNEENSEPRMVRNEENSEPCLVFDEEDGEPRMVFDEEDSKPGVELDTQGSQLCTKRNRRLLQQCTKVIWLSRPDDGKDVTMQLKKISSIMMATCLLLFLAACGGESSTSAPATGPENGADRKLQYRAEQLANLQQEDLEERIKQLEAVKDQLKAKRDEIIGQGGKWVESKLSVLEHQEPFRTEEMKKYLTTLMDLYLPLAEGSVDVVPVTAAYQEDGSLLAVMLLRNGVPGKTLTSADLSKAVLTIYQADGQKVVEVPFAPNAQDIGSLSTGEARPLSIVVDKKDVLNSNYSFQQEGYVFTLQGF